MVWYAHSSPSSRDSCSGSGVSRRPRWPKHLLKQMFNRLEKINFHSDMNKGKNQAATGSAQSAEVKIYLVFTPIPD
jgi:hypothetical protein